MNNCENPNCLLNSDYTPNVVVDEIKSLHEMSWSHPVRSCRITPHGIGDRVILNLGEIQIPDAYVRAIISTSSKTRYSLFIDRAKTTLHNVDSALLAFPDDDKFPNHIEMPEDNYS